MPARPLEGFRAVPRSANAETDPDARRFPVGTKLWKEFRFHGRLFEIPLHRERGGGLEVRGLRVERRRASFGSRS